MIDNQVQGYAHRQAGLEAAKAAFFASGGQAIVLKSFEYVPKPVHPIQPAPPPTFKRRKKQSQPVSCPRFEAVQARVKAQAELVSKLKIMATTMTCHQVAEAAGVDRRKLYSLARAYGFSYQVKHSVDPEADAKLVERIMTFKEIGLTRRQTQIRLDITNRTFIRLMNTYEFEYPSSKAEK